MVLAHSCSGCHLSKGGNQLDFGEEWGREKTSSKLHYLQKSILSSQRACSIDCLLFQSATSHYTIFKKKKENHPQYKSVHEYKYSSMLPILISFFLFFCPTSLCLSHPLYRSLSASLRCYSKQHLFQEDFSAPATQKCPRLLPRLAHLLCAPDILVLLLVNSASSFRSAVNCCLFQAAFQHFPRLG